MSPEDYGKEEPWTPDAGVTEAAALAALYEGHQVKDELVIGPELMQPRDRAGAVAEIGHVFKIPATDLLLEVLVIKEEIISPNEDSCGLNEDGGTQKPTEPGDQLVLRECFVSLDHTLIDKMQKCKKCLKIFASDASLSNHMCLSKAKTKNALRNKKINYTCDICGNHFANRFTLTNHLVIHSGLRAFICELCGKQFTHKRNLLCHSVVHKGRTFFCDICCKGFGLKCTLVRHMRIHTGVRPDKSDVRPDKSGVRPDKSGVRPDKSGVRPDKSGVRPDKSGVRPDKSDVRPDKSGVRPDKSGVRPDKSGVRPDKSGVRPDKSDFLKVFSCKTCSKVFTSYSYLSTHALLHTGEKRFGCDTCSRRFTQKHQLIRHIRIHTKEKPFTCDTCGKLFAAKHHLTRHVLTHTKERPYSCEHCERKFAVKSNLVAHNRTVHTRENSLLNKLVT